MLSNTNFRPILLLTLSAAIVLATSYFLVPSVSGQVNLASLSLTVLLTLVLITIAAYCATISRPARTTDSVLQRSTLQKTGFVLIGVLGFFGTYAVFSETFYLLAQNLPTESRPAIAYSAALAPYSTQVSALISCLAVVQVFLFFTLIWNTCLKQLNAPLVLCLAGAVVLGAVFTPSSGIPGAVAGGLYALTLMLLWNTWTSATAVFGGALVLMGFSLVPSFLSATAVINAQAVLPNVALGALGITLLLIIVGGSKKLAKRSDNTSRATVEAKPA